MSHRKEFRGCVRVRAGRAGRGAAVRRRGEWRDGGVTKALGLQLRLPAPDFGPNVMIFDPSMPTSQIQATVDAIASQQVSNQFGSQRYALLFKPGTYGTAADPLNFQVGYYTAVAGLGLSPNDVVINGSVYVHNQCDGGSCIALNNFWRSLSNLTINVTDPGLRLLQPASSGRCRRPRRCAGSTSTGSPP